MSQLPSLPGRASLLADGNACVPGLNELATELGAPFVVPLSNPNSRSGRRRSSPYSEGRLMEHSPVAPTSVGIDAAKDRLDVHLRPSGEALALGRDRRTSIRWAYLGWQSGAHHGAGRDQCAQSRRADRQPDRAARRRCDPIGDATPAAWSSWSFSRRPATWFRPRIEPARSRRHPSSQRQISGTVASRAARRPCSAG
jgi:hypothetical protein